MTNPRRTFLKLGAMAATVAAFPVRLSHAIAQAMQGARIVRQAAPENLESDFGALSDFITPTDQHYVRSHFAVPQIDAATWTLQVRGAVGQPLTLTFDQGAPARLVVPGCYGMASVKWLSSIEVIKGEFGSYWESTDYAYWDRSTGRPLRRPLMGMQVKSSIAKPSAGGQVARNTAVDIVGAAWSDGNVSRVEVSTDGGATWRDAEFIDPESAVTWRRWRFTWQVPATGSEAVLMSRATDARGRTQPMTRNNDYGTYMIHHVVPVAVKIT